MTTSSTTSLEQYAREARAACVRMAHDGREGHLNGALSSVDILVALYHRWLRVDPAAPKRPDRDRFLFSKGHACTSLYAVMAQTGHMCGDWIERYAQTGGPLPSHPCMHSLPALEWSSGSLGHALGVAAGRAYGLKLDANPARVVVLTSDGECNEGSTWEAATFAAANRLDNLLCIVDYNGVQSVGRADELMGGASIEEKFRAFGWGASWVDGHDTGAILTALDRFPFAPGRPSALIARTVAGRGVTFMEDQVLWHYRVPSDDDLERALAELGCGAGSAADRGSCRAGRGA